MKAFIVFLILSLICGVVVFLVLFGKRKAEEFVDKHSIALEKEKEINSRYIFIAVAPLIMEHIYDNENFYNSISCEDYLIYQMQFPKNRPIEQYRQIESNKEMHDKYLAELSQTYPHGRYDVNVNNLLKKLFDGIEEKKYQRLLHKPTVSTDYTVTLRAARMNGQIYAYKRANIGKEQVLTIIKRLNDRRNGYYNDRGIWDAITRVERGRVSNKMRFAIMKRDCNRCRYCRTAGSYRNPLEIDHIIPIAKGGKSTYDNLQTLCHNCNVAKGDSVGSVPAQNGYRRV